MDKERLHYLLQQYLNNKITREEEEELFARDLLFKFTCSVTPDVDQGWQKLQAAMQAEPQ
ncbi:MAG TPA: hypothetical protein VL727_09215 [Puia sp.]|jgi:hypothetical protein|nr:hypothetical protein [Puia sp.]